MAFTTLLDPRWDAALDELAELQRPRAREFAAEARVLAKLEAQTTRDGWQGDAPCDSLLLDVAGTCLIGQRSASDRIDGAVHLVRRLPILLDELDAGAVGVPQARVLIEETRSLSPIVCAEVESRVRIDARTLAPGHLRRRIRAVILAVDADEAARRAEAAKVDRGVTFRPIEDGQALLIAKGPALQLKALELQLDARGQDPPCRRRLSDARPAALRPAVRTQQRDLRQADAGSDSRPGRDSTWTVRRAGAAGGVRTAGRRRRATASPRCRAAQGLRRPADRPAPRC